MVKPRGGTARVNGEVCVEYLAILPLTNYGQAIATLSRPSYPLPQGRGKDAAPACGDLDVAGGQSSAAGLPLPLWERIRRPGERREPLADVGEG
jgi:hypothetical protein